MSQYTKKLNGTLRFDSQTEGDIVNIIETEAQNKSLMLFISDAIRFAVAHYKEFSSVTEYGNVIDQERQSFFARKHLEIEELTNQLNGDYTKTKEVQEKITIELEKLYILAESRRLFELGASTKALALENVLIGHEKKRLLTEIWNGKRPILTMQEEQELGAQLPELAEEVMVYLIKHYEKELSELKSAVQTPVVQAPIQAPMAQAPIQAFQAVQAVQAATAPYSEPDLDDFENSFPGII